MAGAGLRLRQVASLAQIPAAGWDALFGDDHPFARHGWLSRLEQHGCVGGDSGWEPCHLLAEDAAGTLLGAAPLYLKRHSYGEFVFDFAWADASHRIGQRYYPKLLNAIPFVPSTGPRLGARDEAIRAALARRLSELPEEQGLSSSHTLFADPPAAAALSSRDLLERHDVQFHWHDRCYGDFAGFVATLTSDKRKKLLRDRRRVEGAGIEFAVMQGRDLQDRDWDEVHALYAHTYHQRGQLPYYSRDFLADVGASTELDLRLIFALHEGRRVAVAITVVGGRTLYGRHWGARAHFDALHFECCYYQGIELCLRESLTRFDAGTQGAHKQGRGFEPERTRSFHHLTDPRLRRAVADYLERERAVVAAQQAELLLHNPFRSDSG